MSATTESPSPRLLGASPRRKRVNRMMELLSSLAAGLAVAVLVIVVGSVLIKGVSALNLSFLTETPAPFGVAGGGIANSIVGTFLLVVIASAIAVPVGLLIGIHASEFARPRTSNAVKFALDILSGVPTIVTGIFIFGLLVAGHQQSGYDGSVALAIIMLPIVARSAQEVLQLVPNSLREAAVALGIARWRMVLRVVLPTAAGGLITGAVLGVARVAGETAPLLLTSSIASNAVSWNPGQALSSIPVTIFTLSESANPADHARGWAAALVLIVGVLALSGFARSLHERSRRRLRG
jgi:phosphate transport system permease protein